MRKYLLNCLLTACLLFTGATALAAFDPVNDDTDIFLANPTIAAERPNVLVILDNTANWNNAFINEKAALVSVVNGLNESYNVGLMMFPETGNPNDSVDGGYVRFGVRQMTAANKIALASIVSGLDIGNDKGNNATTGLALYEAYRYYGGLTSIASFGKIKTDFANNTIGNPLAANLSYNNDSPATRSGNALPATPTSSSLFNSPISAGCQKNFIIYISNGKANENASARSWLEDKLATLTGSTPPHTINISPNGQEGNWADEMAQYMANADVNTAYAGSQNVVTYTVEVDPGTQAADLDMTALMRSVAYVGKGKYFAVTSANSGTSITDALNKIFTEVQAVNSVFASTTLPVSVNVRGTNINQVYIGVFRPDAQKAPRWLGNLKLYNLALTSGVVYLADATGAHAEDSTTGFITPNATSFWTSSALTPTNFWSYRLPDVNGVGGASDAPDGDLVEKGGVAQQIRNAYEASQTSRRLFTCTTGGALPDCVPCTRGGSTPSQTCSNGSALSATPFSTANTAISVSALNLNTQSIASLSGKRTVNITSLTDRGPATLTRALSSGSSATATRISSGSGATSKTISTLTTAAPVSITNIISGQIDTQSTTTTALTWTFNLTKKSGNNTTWNITTGATPTAPAGQTFTNAPRITSAVSGNTSILSASGACEGIATPTLNISSSVPAGTGANAAPSGSARWEATGSQNSGTSCTVTVSLASTYSYTAATTSSTATVTTATPHGYLGGQSVTVSASNSALNCNSAGITVLSATSFSCTLPAPQYSAGGVTGTVTGSSQIITVGSTAHGYTAGDDIIISGASPSGYNGTYRVLTNNSVVATLGRDATPANNFLDVTGWPALTANTFVLVKTENLYANLLAANTASPVYAVKTTGATAVSSLTLTFAANPFNITDIMQISGAAVSGYNVPSPAACSVTAVTATTATCDLSTPVTGPLPDDTAGTATAVSSAVYGATITANVSLPAASMPLYGLVNGAQIIVESVDNADAGFAAAPGPYTITNVNADGTFTFDTAFLTETVGSYKVRLNSPLAYVTAPAHGFSDGQEVTIAGVDIPHAAYNLTTTASASPNQASNLMVIDADNFTYPLPSAPGTATVMGTASINTTTATAQANNHGFANGASISISGATPSEFNGTVTITVTDAHHFTYTLSSAQGDATGAIVAVAAAAGASLRDDIIGWVRGADNSENENNDCTLEPYFPCVPVTNIIARKTDIRASIHGDVLHSRPAVINYGRFGGDNDVYIFYGANDGIFHAVKGGMTTDADDTSGLTPGQEAWGFVASEFFSKLQRLRNNSPAISNYNKKPYFADGPIGVYTKAGANKMLGDNGDVANLYIGMRRGGRGIYALDVNNPLHPRLLWAIDNTHKSNSRTDTSARFSELGQTWSEPKVVEGINGYGCPNNIATTANCTGNPVLIFGGGYDETVEDINPSTITSSTATTVTTAAGTFTRSMGRAIYVVDAITGRRVVSIGGEYSHGDNDHGVNYDHDGDPATAEIAYLQPDKIVSGMDCAIPSDVTVIKNLSGGAVNRAYVGDTCGNLWRLDFGNTYNSDSAASRASWVTVTKIASVGGTANADRRKFLYPPDVVAATSTVPYDSLLIGSGDREHPFDTTVVNRMYMFKDRGGDLGSANNGPYTGTAKDVLVYPTEANDFDPDYPTISGAASPPASPIPANTPNNWLYDATNNCLQQACPPGTVMTAAALATQIAAEKVLLDAANGWYFTLASGEKVIGNAVALAGTVFFNTNQPSAAAGGGSCGSNLGFARQYQVGVADATATSNLDTSNAALNIADRSALHAGGGYLPSGVHVVVQLTDTATGKTETKEAVISGTEVMTPGQTPLMTRFRKYWYKEIDQ